MSSKKTTSTNQTQNTAQNSTSTPNVPSWIAQPAQTLAGTVTAFQNQGSDIYAPVMSDLQTQATNAAGNLGTSGYYGQAASVLNGLPQTTTGGAIGNISNGGQIDPLTGQSVLSNLSAYENPYKDQVINPVLAQYDYQSGQTRAAQAAAAAQGGAFGGSRYGVQEANTEGQLAMGRASTQGGLLNQMYTQAAGMSEADTQRRQAADLANQQGQEFTAGQNLTAAQANQQAQQFMAGQTMSASQANQAAALQQAGLLTGLGTAQDTSNRANVTLQDQVGAQASDLQNAQRQYPLQFEAQLASLLQGVNPALYTGQSASGYGSGASQGTSTETSNPGVLGALGTAAQIGSMFSPATGGLSGLGNLFGGFQQQQIPSSLSNMSFA